MTTIQTTDMITAITLGDFAKLFFVEIENYVNQRHVGVLSEALRTDGAKTQLWLASRAMGVYNEEIRPYTHIPDKLYVSFNKTEYDYLEYLSDVFQFYFKKQAIAPNLGNLTVVVFMRVLVQLINQKGSRYINYNDFMQYIHSIPEIESRQMFSTLQNYMSDLN